MGRNLLTATFDAATELKDAGAVTASGAAQVGGSARVVNVGNGILQAVLVIDVDALDITTGDEAYEVRLQGSSSPTFATDVHVLTSKRVGDSTTTGESVDAGVGRYTLPFVNSSDGETPLPYLRAYHVIAGTTPSANYRAWITKNPTAA
jgi:hypothetical protein